MKNNTKIVAAIDIRTSHIVSVVGSLEKKGNLDLLGLSKTDIKVTKNGIILNKFNIIDAIRYTVEDIQKQAGIVISEAYVGIGGLRITSSREVAFINRSLSDDEISKKDTDQLMEKALNTKIPVGAEIINIIPHGYIIDGEKDIKSPWDCNGLRFELVYLIVTDLNSSVSQIRQCVNLSGIHVNDIILASVAASASVLTEIDTWNGVLLMDIEAESADIVIYFECQIRHISAIHFAPKQTSMTGIADIIVNQIDVTGYKKKLDAGIVITGRVAGMDNLIQYLKMKTDLNVRIGLPNTHISHNQDIDPDSPEFSSSLGLLNIGFEKENSEVYP